MSINEKAVAGHYGKGGLFERIISTLRAEGIDPDHIKPEDLKAIEEFHIGGREATAYATQKMDLDRDTHVLDIGCGIGGAARYIAHQFGSHVSGIDLTPEYIEVGRLLNDKLGLSDNLNFDVASALELPFDDRSFDRAITMHVAMNIKDRAGMYQEAARVLKPGSIFCVYDVMKKGDEPVLYPVPWAASPETSHLTTSGEMEGLLSNTGFEILEIEDRSAFARDFFEKAVAAAAKAEKKPGVHVIMGDGAPDKMKNIRANVYEGRVAPTLMLARRSP